MEHVVYYVLLHRGEWHIEHNGVHYGPHRNKEAALKLAIGAAKIAERDGDSAEVIVLSREHYVNEWKQSKNQHSFAFA